VSPEPVVSVVVPTRNRAGYLDVTLRSLAAQDVPHEVIVVDDASDDGTQRVAEAAGVRYLRQDTPSGPNAARNRGAAEASAGLIAFVDDDVDAPPGWLRALVDGAERHPGALTLGGPIRARFDGPAPRGCGREQPPITTLDLGDMDTEARFVWSANMLVRREALELAGEFDEGLPPGGDEEEWLRRLHDRGGRVMYVADAWLWHRRAGDDARLRSLMRGAYHRGRNLRAWDVRRGEAPPFRSELRVLAGCGWHTLRRACPQGLVMGAHSAGRAVEAVRPR
jgi:glycosyltransferase involved in cell wall biosynthesis